MDTSQLINWKFTLTSSFGDWKKVKESLNQYCKKWVFQLELGDGGFEHYQGWCKLKQKKRIGFWKTMPIFPGPNGVEMGHWGPESNNNMKRGEAWYEMKEETRVEGPWKDTDAPVFIPRQVSKITSLYPWQEEVIRISKEEYGSNQSRTVNCILDFNGCQGKTTLAMYMECHGLGDMIPFTNDYKDLNRYICCFPGKKCYLLDMPRAMKKDKLQGLYGALETLKFGFACDDRFKHKKVRFDSPSVWVFTNSVPELEFLSLDRWKFWSISASKELQLEDVEDVVLCKKAGDLSTKGRAGPPAEC